MAGWLKIALRSFAVAAGAGAAQLGTAQALSMLVWSTVPTPEVWRRQLTWLVFIFATAVLTGVAGGRRSVRTVRQAIANRRTEAAAAWHSGVVPHRTGVRASSQRAVGAARHRALDLLRRFAIGATRVHAAGFAALGAFTTFVLVWLPARNALPAADIRTLAVAAGIGTAVGAVVALLALIAAPIAANVAIWIGAMWIFGLASAGLAIAMGEPTTAPRLGVLDAPHLIGPGEWWLGPNVMIVVAAFFAFAVAATARWVTANKVAIAVSGLAGPGLVATTYLIVGSGEGLRSAFIAALIAPFVSVAASIGTALARRPGKKGAAPEAAASALGGPATLTAPAPSTAAIPPPATIPPPVTPQPVYATGAPRAAPNPYPQPNPASQYPAAQYSANPYPTNQYPTAPGPAQPFTVEVPVSVPPQRPAPPPRPAPSPPVAKPPPAPTPVTPPPPPTPAPPVATTPPPAATVTPPRPAPRGRTGKAAATAAPAAAAGAAAGAAAEQSPVASKPRQRGRAERTVRGSEKPPASAQASPAKQSGPPKGESSRAKGESSRAKGESSRAKRAKQPVQAEPMGSAPAADDALPRTARPAQVVAVQPTRPSPEAEPGPPKGRRARRRAAKLAAARAEEEARIAKQIEHEERAMGKREREHVDWVKHLTSIPPDPTLTSRKK